MKKIILSRKAVHWDSQLSSYKLLLEVISSEGITKEIFVKQRLHRGMSATIEDVFAAIATPVQMEDLDINSPSADTSYFRVSKIELTGASAEFIEEVFNSIVSDIQKLVGDVEVLEELAPDGIYTITSDEVEVDMGIPHTHYRIPLIAQPCGLNEIFTEGGDQKHRVGNQDTAKIGWLNSVYQGIYKFQYNLATDSSLSGLWPIQAIKLPYAFVEVNGVQVTDNILIDSTGIYWKNNLLGYAPWPKDWINQGNPGSIENQVRIVFDFIY